MQINVVKSEEGSSRWGHGVLFYYEKYGRDKRLAVAFVENFEWLHQNPETVTVHLLKVDPAQLVAIGESSDEIAKEVLSFVKEFLESKGKKERSEYITTHWNA